MTKVIGIIFIVSLIFTSCSRRNITEEELKTDLYSNSSTYTPEITDTEQNYSQEDCNMPSAPDSEQKTTLYPIQNLPYATEQLELPNLVPPRFIAIEGVIVDFDGPIADDGTVPWYVDWFRIDILKECGNPAIIVGVHQTAFIFGRKPAIGMAVRAYFPEGSTVFISDPPLYIATAIVAGMPPELSVRVCSFLQVGRLYKSVHDPFFFRRDDYTVVTRAGKKCNWMLWGYDLHERSAAVVYKTAYDETVTAIHTVILSDGLPIPRWANFWTVVSTDDDPADYVTLTFTDYIFPASTFRAANLPIYVHGTRIESPPPILALDGNTVFVPFRHVFMAGLGFGNYAMLTNDGGLRFGGGGGGSENSHWEVGRASWTGMGFWPLDTPPIIVGGIIYVSFDSMRSAPFASGWLFDDRIYFYDSFTFGSGYYQLFHNIDATSADEIEVSIPVPIVVNGARINSPAILYERSRFERTGTFWIPLAPIADFLGYHIYYYNEWGRAELYLQDNYLAKIVQFYDYRLVDDELYIDLAHAFGWNFHFIAHNGRILIEVKPPPEQINRITEE